MQLLRWLKRKKEIVFIPVGGDGVPYTTKWKDEQYLKSVEGMSLNNVWSTEIVEAITQIRNKADEAQSVDSLKAYNDCIKIVKDLLLKYEYAKLTRRYLENEQSGNNDMSSLK